MGCHPHRRGLLLSSRLPAFGRAVPLRPLLSSLALDFPRKTPSLLSPSNRIFLLSPPSFSPCVCLCVSLSPPPPPLSGSLFMAPPSEFHLQPGRLRSVPGRAKRRKSDHSSGPAPSLPSLPRSPPGGCCCCQHRSPLDPGPQPVCLLPPRGEALQ